MRDTHATRINEVKNWVTKNPHFAGEALKRDYSTDPRPGEATFLCLTGDNRIFIPSELNKKCFLKPSERDGFMFEWDNEAELLANVVLPKWALVTTPVRTYDLKAEVWCGIRQGRVVSKIIKEIDGEPLPGYLIKGEASLYFAASRYASDYVIVEE